MKKIMFSTKYGLEQAVLSYNKNMTRRADSRLNNPLVTKISRWHIDAKGKRYLTLTYTTGFTEDIYPAYQIDEVLAIAQPYKDLIRQGHLCRASDGWSSEEYVTVPGYKNKMFVRADLMPHRIRITDIRIERMQDISDEDCIREGIMKGEFTHTRETYYYDVCGDVSNQITFSTPRDAFASLIDKVSGKGTWERNPLVFVYSFWT